MKKEDFDALSLASVKRMFLNVEIATKRPVVEDNVGLIANQSKTNKNLNHIECFKCGKKGHYQNKYPEKTENRAYWQVAM